MADIKKTTKDLTQGNITKTLIAFAIPLMATYFLQLMYSTVDMAIVGKFIGESGVAAISSGSEVINLYTFLCIGFCNGGQSLIAQLIGVKKTEKFNGAIGTVLISSVVLGIIICIATLLGHNWIIDILKVPDVSKVMANQYLMICSVGMIFAFGYNAFTICFRAFGDSKSPLRFVAISTVVNIILDLLFVGLFNMSVMGAALATAIGQIVSFFLAMITFMKTSVHEEYEFKLKNLSCNLHDLKIMIDIGLPLAIQSTIIHISMLYVNRLINALGVTAAATFAIGIKIDDMCAKTSLGLQYAGGPIISQNFAKKDYDRVSKTIINIWVCALTFHLLYAAVYFFFPEQVFSLFIKNDSTDVLALAPVFVKNIIYTFIPLALLRGVNAMYVGIGKGKLSLMFSLIDSVAGRVGLSLLFGYVLKGGFAGFVLCYGLAPAGAAIPGLIYFISGKWKKAKTLVD